MNNTQAKQSPDYIREERRFQNFLCEQNDDVCTAAAELYSTLTNEPVTKVLMDAEKVWAAIEAIGEFCRAVGTEAPCAPFLETDEFAEDEAFNLLKPDDQDGTPCWYRGICDRTDSGYPCPYLSPVINLGSLHEHSDYENFTAWAAELRPGTPAMVVFKEADGTPAYCTDSGDFSFAGVINEVVELPLEGNDPAHTYLSDSNYDVACEFVNDNGCYAVGIRKCRLLTQEEYEYNKTGRILTGPVTVCELYNRLITSRFGMEWIISFDGAAKCFYSAVKNELLFDDVKPEKGDWEEVSQWPVEDHEKMVSWLATYGCAVINVMGEDYDVYADVASRTVILTAEGRYHG